MKNQLNNHELKREIGLFTAIALVIANMVGSGIFTTSGFIIKEVGSAGALLWCWLVGGLFALCGALCYGELGARYPYAGGEYVYLRESFGKPMAFLSGWISLFVGFSAPIAAAGIAFATYLFQALSINPGSSFSLSILNMQVITLSPQALVGIFVVALLSLLHYHSLRIGSQVQNFLTIFKIGLIILFITAGLLSSGGSSTNFTAILPTDGLLHEKFAVSLIFVSFAYSGWNAAAYLGGEIKRPSRNIPLALFIGTLIVLVLYLLINVVYILALSPSQMQGTMDIGAKAAIQLFGTRVSQYISGAIAIGLLSVLSAMILTGPRVYYAMSKDRVFFTLFGKISNRRHTPAYSIVLQAIIASLMIITASYDKLLLYIGFTLSLFAMFTVIGLMLIRTRRPAHETPYRTLGYPLTPLIFIAGNLWIIYFSIKSRPLPALFGTLTILMGLGVYFYFKRRQTKKEMSINRQDEVTRMSV